VFEFLSICRAADDSRLDLAALRREVYIKPLAGIHLTGLVRAGAPQGRFTGSLEGDPGSARASAWQMKVIQRLGLFPVRLNGYPRNLFIRHYSHRVTA
jgi:hypothetical protein